MKKVKIISSTLALLFGFLIFGLSLIVTSQVNSNFGNSPKASERKFYVGERILPDHIFYPLLMVADKIILETSFGDRRVYVKIRLAEDRLYSAKFLLEKGEEELALSTLTKSQKYLITAAQDLLQKQDGTKQQQSQVLQRVRKDLLLALKDNSKVLKACQHDFVFIETGPVEDLLMESQVLVEQLDNTTIL